MNLLLSGQAWSMAGICDISMNNSVEDDFLVFGSEIDVASLADEALRRWIAVYLLSE